MRSKGMKLLLTSEGLSSPKIIKAFKDLVQKPLSQIKVAFIPTAAYGESSDVGWMQRDVKSFKRLGLRQIEMADLREYQQAELKIKLKQANVIFVEGGNTFFLLDRMRRSGFEQLLPELLARGAVYVGVSAGSIVAGPSLEICTIGNFDENKVGLKDLRGLGLVDFVVFPHYGREWDKVYVKYQKRAQYPVIPLTDNQAIVVENDTWKIV